MDRDKIPKDPLHQRIYLLENTIRKFKRYDKDRTEFLHKIQDELEDYSEKYLLLKDAVSKDDRYSKLEEKIKNLRLNLGAVNKKYNQLKKEMELIQDEELLKRAEYAIQHYDVAKLQEKCNSLDKEIDSLRVTNKELVTRIVQLNTKLKQYEN